MLSSSRCFDQLPVELLHNLFEYFAAHEILLAFTDLNEHINGSLRSYWNYKVVFKSTREAQLDLIACYIQPEQIASLTLCADQNSASDQSQNFFSRFHIEQFTRLQALTLIKIEPETLQSILPHLSKLHSFSFNYVSMQYTQMVEYSHLASLLTNNFNPIVFQLKFLPRNSEKTALPALHSPVYSRQHSNCPLTDYKQFFSMYPNFDRFEFHSISQDGGHK